MSRGLSSPRLPAPGEVHVWWARLDDPAWRRPALAVTLDAGERQRAADLVGERDRRRYIAASGILRQVLGACLGRPPGELRLRRSALGKPELAGQPGTGALRFSLSRSGGLALVAVARDRRVGVDVEAVRPLAEPGAIARLALDPHAAAAVLALPPSRRDAALLASWTRTEAYVKARGDGLRRAGRLTLERQPAGPARVRAAGGLAPEGTWCVEEVAPLPAHVAAVAAEGAGWRLRAWPLEPWVAVGTGRARPRRQPGPAGFGTAVA
jgi:4'-phosphopantetheinyl transferase